MNMLLIVTTLCVVLIIATAVLLAYVVADRAIIAQLEDELCMAIDARDQNQSEITQLQVDAVNTNTWLNEALYERDTQAALAAQLSRDNYAYAVKLADRLNEVNELKLRVSRLQKQQRVQVNQ